MNELLCIAGQIIEMILAIIGGAVIVLIIWFESDCKESADRQKEMHEEYEEFW